MNTRFREWDTTIQCHVCATIGKRFHHSERFAGKLQELGASDSSVEDENAGGENDDDTGAG